MNRARPVIKLTAATVLTAVADAPIIGPLTLAVAVISLVVALLGKDPVPVIPLPTATVAHPATLTPLSTDGPSEAALTSPTKIPTSGPTEVPPLNECVTPVRIKKPSDGGSVPVRVTVDGWSCGVSAGQGPDSRPPWIYVLTLPLAGRDPDQDWLVQPHPEVLNDTSWQASISVGSESSPPGLSFSICVVVSEERLPVGPYGKDLPPSQHMECITVGRE